MGSLSSSAELGPPRRSPRLSRAAVRHTAGEPAAPVIWPEPEHPHRRDESQWLWRSTSGCGDNDQTLSATSVGAPECPSARSASPLARSDLALTAFGASQDAACSNHGMWRTNGCGDLELPLSLATPTGPSTSPTSSAQVVQLSLAPPPAHSVPTAAHQPVAAPPALANQMLWRSIGGRGSIPHPPDLPWRGADSREPLAVPGAPARAEARRASGRNRMSRSDGVPQGQLDALRLAGALTFVCPTQGCGSLIHLQAARRAARAAGRAHYEDGDGCGSPSCSRDFRRGKFVGRQLARAAELLRCNRILIARPELLCEGSVLALRTSTQRAAAISAAHMASATSRP